MIYIPTWLEAIALTLLVMFIMFFTPIMFFGLVWWIEKKGGDYMPKEIQLVCNAPDEVFTPNYEDVPVEHKKIIERQGNLGCEGGGVEGWWCVRPFKCHYLEERKVDIN